MADLMPWEEAQQAAAPSTPAPTTTATAAPKMPWEEAQAAASSYVKTPSEVDAAITGAPAAGDTKQTPMATTPPQNPKIDNRSQAQIEAANAVNDNEAGKNFDYTQSPLRHIMSEDSARQLVGSQLSSQDRSLAFDSSMQNAVLLGTGNWLDRHINGNSTGPGTSSETMQIPAGVSEPDYAEAARAAHPIASDVGTGVGMVAGLAGRLPKAAAAAAGGVIDTIKPAVAKLGGMAWSTLKHAPSIAVGTYLEEKARHAWEAMKEGGDGDEE
jgi:hypothetical protein